MVQMGLPEKELEKTSRDLRDLHERVLLHWLIERDIDYITRKKFFTIYDFYVNNDNIIYFFHLPVKVFVISLIKKELGKFIPKDTKKKKHHKSKL